MLIFVLTFGSLVDIFERDGLTIQERR